MGTRLIDEQAESNMIYETHLLFEKNIMITRVLRSRNNSVV